MITQKYFKAVLSYTAETTTKLESFLESQKKVLFSHMAYRKKHFVATNSSTREGIFSCIGIIPYLNWITQAHWRNNRYSGDESKERRQRHIFSHFMSTCMYINKHAEFTLHRLRKACMDFTCTCHSMKCQ